MGAIRADKRGSTPALLIEAVEFNAGRAPSISATQACMGFSWRHTLFLGLLSATLLGGACADFGRGPTPDASVDRASERGLVDDPVFENDVYPILQTRCQSCHSKGGDGEYTQYVLTGNAKADRAMVVAQVSPNFPEGSLLLLRATGYDHLGGQLLSVNDPEYAIIEDWIASLPSATCP